jgi:hypothetical protein
MLANSSPEAVEDSNFLEENTSAHAMMFPAGTISLLASISLF